MHALLLALAAFAQSSPTSPADPAPVSVEYANLHRVVFSTPDYAVLQNIYPPRSESGFHVHSRDLFYVLISTARFGTRRPGQEVRMAPSLPVGTVGMNVMDGGPVVHTVVNDDDHPFKIVALELRAAAPSGRPVTVRPPSSGFVQVHDHSKLRAWRLILQPGDTTPPLTISGAGMRIYVKGGMLSLLRHDKPVQSFSVSAGDFEQVEPGTSLALRNSGNTTIELIDVELK